MHVAAQLRATIPQGDIAARIGGDEFVVVGEARVADATVLLSASVGVAFVGRDEQADSDDLLSRADAAMYDVKRRRRDAGDAT